MKVVNHRLEGVPFIPSPNMSGFITPTGAIMHYTAGWTASSAIKTLTNPAAKVSAQLVIDRDGSITQLVPFNRAAWHAGPSAWDGRKGCNNFTIGFEFVNPGYFRIGKNGEIMDWEGKQVLSAERLKGYDLSVRAPDKRIGGGTFIWPGYTDIQIEAGLEALAAIERHYDLTFVTGHENIDTRGWKTDPGDAFPMSRFQAVVHGSPVGDGDRSDGMIPLKSRMTVNTPKLNVRDKPNAVTGRVVTVLTGGSEVIILEDTGDWSRVQYAPGKEGWLADKYLKKG